MLYIDTKGRPIAQPAEWPLTAELLRAYDSEVNQPKWTKGALVVGHCAYQYYPTWPKGIYFVDICGIIC